MEKLNLLLAIHCHQPIGNFGAVFSKAYEMAYLPFIEVLDRHPRIKISLHYSGSLLDWLKQNQPEFLNRIRNLVKRGQVEILAGGYYEPILSLIPESDAIEQIKMLKEEILDKFCWEADGLWLTERIWEPKLPKLLNSAGIGWTIVDDSHFKSAGMNPEELSGYYLTEEEGMTLKIFGASEKLRYCLPFKLPQVSIDYLKNLYQDRKVKCVCFADDGEKFGLWPGTNKWVYEEKWLENFLVAIEKNSSWLRTQGFKQYLDQNPPTGRVYLNCASYREMMEWSGGFFRNFLLKYPEANWMHKRMLYVSKKNKNSQLTEARRHLYMGQNNDAYWHGVFGGLYLNHLRSSVYFHLIEAEKLLQGLKAGFNNLEELDLDCDGQREIILSNDLFSCIFAPHRGGTLRELDFKPKSTNLINTIMRRPETYHQKIKQKTVNPHVKNSQPQSIHDLEKIKQEGLENFLFYDAYPRACCLDHFLPSDTTLGQFIRCEYIELGDFIQGEYKVKTFRKGKNKIGLNLTRIGKVTNQELALFKKIDIESNELSLNYVIENKSASVLTTRFGIEFNLSVYDNLISSKSGEMEALAFRLNDIWNGLSIEFNIDKPVWIWHFPVETVSDSESGVEKTYQELCLFFSWQLNLDVRKDWSINLSLKID